MLVHYKGGSPERDDPQKSEKKDNLYAHFDGGGGCVAVVVILAPETAYVFPPHAKTPCYLVLLLPPSCIETIVVKLGAARSPLCSRHHPLAAAAAAPAAGPLDLIFSLKRRSVNKHRHTHTHRQTYCSPIPFLSPPPNFLPYFLNPVSLSPLGTTERRRREGRRQRAVRAGRDITCPLHTHNTTRARQAGGGRTHSRENRAPPP